MPWDGTELWVADVDADGALTNARRVAGSETESIYQPGWSPGGELWFVSDRDDRWRLYRVVPGYRWAAGSSDPASRLLPVEPAPPADAETGRPQWILGTSCWAFTSAARVVVSYTREGRWHLGCADLDTGAFRELVPGLEPGPWLAAADGEVVLVAGSATAPDAVMAVRRRVGRHPRAARGGGHVDRRGLPLRAAVALVSHRRDRTAQLFYYPPRNRDFVPIDGERPPLIVISHGGPVAAADSTLDYTVQFWTSRGFAVADVNYGGSTGFGRAYRQRLNGQWGVVDVADSSRPPSSWCARARPTPRGSSSAAAAPAGSPRWRRSPSIPDVFKAGASYYGVSDLEAHPARLAQVRGAVPRYPRRSLPGDESALRGAVAGSRGGSARRAR